MYPVSLRLPAARPARRYPHGGRAPRFLASLVELSHFQIVTESEREGKKTRGALHASPAAVSALTRGDTHKRVRVKPRSDKNKPLLLRPLLGKLNSPVNV